MNFSRNILVIKLVSKRSWKCWVFVGVGERARERLKGSRFLLGRGWSMCKGMAGLSSRVRPWVAAVVKAAQNAKRM